MMKLLTFCLTGALSLSALAVEVPESLRALLKNQKEQTYVGDDCEIKVFENTQGFYLDAYQREPNGEIDQTRNFGRMSITPSDEVYDYWKYPYGFDADIRYYSDFGASFDHFTKIEVDTYPDGSSDVDIVFKKNNGYWMYTYYRFDCKVNF